MKLPRNETVDNLSRTLALHRASWKDIDNIIANRTKRDSLIFVSSDELITHADAKHESLKSQYLTECEKIAKKADEFRSREDLEDRVKSCLKDLDINKAEFVAKAEDYANTVRRISYDFDIQAFASWRPTQGIYRLDSDFAKELSHTGSMDEIPVDVLKMLPEWCVYIEFPANDKDERMGGFVRFDRFKGQQFLCFTVATNGIVHGNLPSIAMTLGLCMNEAITTARYEVWGGDTLLCRSNDPRELMNEEEQRKILKLLLNATLYICSANADVVNRRTGLRPFRPTAKVVRGMPRFFPPDNPVTWECGYRIGAIIRKAKQQREEELRKQREDPAVHASPIPHLRRAHWHRFWIGKRASVIDAQPTERQLIVKWLHPIIVNAERGSIVPVLHTVLSAEEETSTK